MTNLVEFIWGGTAAIGIPLIVVLVTTVSPLRGEMCSTLVSATDEGGIADLATLQARAFAAFRSACRKPRMHLSCKQNSKFKLLKLHNTKFIKVTWKWYFVKIILLSLKYVF